ncbi:BA14K family protein [Jiella sonneratiae]|uniref:Lectin-like protein BA14k n=1 Tax=Jiella sonneratiae TaxID=2816856 RepID=A0ABS3J3Z2_9HYPH|nr:BA14K family protein [Jiella sonneratiae]MBO0904379.1 BA14K family protein [Jiella sonneratiae]
MRKIISTALAAVLALGTLGAGVSTASADSNGRHWYRNGGHYDANGWSGHRRWRGDRHYRYRHHDNGAAVGAGIAGLAIGAIVGGALADHGHYYRRAVPVYRVHPGARGHVARCDAHYRSYNPRTDTFVGYDGRHHRCRL